MTLTVAETFAGAGGAALGLEAAGLEHVALVEWDADACATLRAAGFRHVVEGDVRTAEIPHADVLWSSFPCQVFSTAGSREGAEGERNGWPWTADAIDRVKPTWFLGENVPGLLRHDSGCGRGQLVLFGRATACNAGCYFERTILADLRARFAHVGWWVLDAADYGVPQHRPRVILWAGPAPITRPAATHGPGLLPYVSSGEALGIVGTLDGGRNSAANPGQERVRSTSEPAQTVGGRGNLMVTLDGGRGTARDVRSVKAPAATVTAGSMMMTARVVGGGANPRFPGDRRTEADITSRPSTTIGATYANQRPSIVTGETRRRLTVEECAALQGFPAGYPWQGATLESRFRQVGNAVPPALAEAVARSLLAANADHGGIVGKIKRPEISP